MASHHTFMPVKDVTAAAVVDNIHVSLLSTRLKTAGLQTFMPCGKMALSQDYKASRPLFAQETLARYPAEFWKSVFFSDEKIFKTDLTGIVSVRRQRGTRQKECFTVTVTKDSSGQDSVHCWGCIDGHWNRELTVSRDATPRPATSLCSRMCSSTLQAMRPGESHMSFNRTMLPSTRRG